MTLAEARRLKAGDRVTWDRKASEQGTVRDTGYAGVQVEWDDGVWSIVPLEAGHAALEALGRVS